MLWWLTALSLQQGGVGGTLHSAPPQVLHHFWGPLGNHPLLGQRLPASHSQSVLKLLSHLTKLGNLIKCIFLGLSKFTKS